jgi:hypothetical protein
LKQGECDGEFEEEKGEKKENGRVACLTLLLRKRMTRKRMNGRLCPPAQQRHCTASSDARWEGERLKKDQSTQLDEGGRKDRSEENDDGDDEDRRRQPATATGKQKGRIASKERDRKMGTLDKHAQRERNTEIYSTTAATVRSSLLVLDACSCRCRCLTVRKLELLLEV